MSSERAVFIDTEVFKGPRLSTHNILDLQTHFQPSETFNIHTFHDLSHIKLPKLASLRTNSEKTLNKANETLSTDSI